MKALTLHQPYATAIAERLKGIETRGAPPAGSMCPPGVRPLPGLAVERGDLLAIHAAAKAPSPYWRAGDFRIRTFGRFGLALEGPGHPYASTPKLVATVLPRGRIVATCRLLDVVPIVRPASETGVVPPDRALIDPGPDRGLRWTEPSPGGTEGVGWRLHHCEDDRLWGDYRPGRWAWLLDDVKPTTERCPACMPDAAGTVQVDPTHRVPLAYVTPSERCSTCGSTGRCEPVPARGRQGLWEWTP